MKHKRRERKKLSAKISITFKKALSIVLAALFLAISINSEPAYAYSGFSSAGIFGVPVDNRNVLMRTFSAHTNLPRGVDLQVGYGTAVYAPFSGNLQYYCRSAIIDGRRETVSYGNYLVLTTKINGVTYKFRLAHMSAFADGYSISNVTQAHDTKNARRSWSNCVNKSRREDAVGSSHYVKEGEYIGRTGDCGYSSGNHAHIEIYVNGTLKDPNLYITSNYTAHSRYTEDQPNNFDKDSRYPVPFIAYPVQTSGKIPVYDSSLSQYSISQHYIAWDDRCTVNEVYTNGYCKVTYPTSSGNSTKYTKLSYFISGGLTPYNYSPPGNKDAYTRVDMGDVLGEVFSTDNCKVVAESGDKLQVIYPTKSGYKCGWIYGSDSSTYGQAMDQGIGRTLADGDYYIVAAADPTYFLDISGTSIPAAEGDNVQLYQTNDGIIPDCDAWTVIYNEGFYTITQKGTDRALDVNKGSLEEGANVQVWHSKNNSAQQWAISNNGNQGYRLQARCSGFSLDINTGVLSKGENIQQWTGNNTDAQRWLFVPCHPEQSIEEGRYVLVSASDEDYELDIPGDTESVGNNTGMRIWKDSECLSRYNAFDIEALDNGYYTLTNTASGKVLATPDNTMNKSSIIVRDSNGEATEEWAISRDGVNGGFTLRTRYSGLTIDVTNNEMVNGTAVIQYPHKRSDNQTWKLVKAEHTVAYHIESNPLIPESQIKYYKEPLTITDVVPVKEGYIFCGWSTEEDDNIPEILPGDTIFEDEDMNLYAVWEEEKIILPDDMTEIEEEAFCNSSIENVIIPENCTKIGKRAFAECSQLRNVSIPRNTTQIASDAFEGSENITLYVYENSYAYSYAIENDINYNIVP